MSAARQRKGTGSLGRAAILSRGPPGKSTGSKKSPALRFHAFRKAVRWEFCDGYSRIVAAFREASEELRAGDLGAKFPAGSFTPVLRTSRKPREFSLRQAKLSREPWARPPGGEPYAQFSPVSLFLASKKRAQ